MFPKIVDVILAAAIVLVALGGPARGVEPAEYRAPEEKRAAAKGARVAELAYRRELVYLREPVKRPPPGQARHQRRRGNRYGQRRVAQQYYAAALTLDQAKAAFRQGNYRDAARLAGRAAVERPRNSEVHQFMALTLFAVSDYRGAAAAAHAALSLGEHWDWSALRRHYSKAADYTQQLRKLEKYTRENPSAAYGYFVLGYQYLMLGHTETARQKFSRVAELAPEDELAARLLDRLNADDGAGSQEVPALPESRAPQDDGHDQGDQKKLLTEDT